LKLFFLKMRFKRDEGKRRIIYRPGVYNCATGLKNAKNAKCGHISQRSRIVPMKNLYRNGLFVYMNMFDALNFRMRVLTDHIQFAVFYLPGFPQKPQKTFILDGFHQYQGIAIR